VLREFGLSGLVEPLGFESSSLRQKSEAVDVIDAMGVNECVKIVRDTFHHHLAGGGQIFPMHTGIVHISGVVNPEIASSQMQDAHRVLVDENDRLGNIGQIMALRKTGYAGPLSFEAFSPEVHEVTDPKAKISKSMEIINTSVVKPV
jgi:2-keto-myo-inositol isomerase